MLVGIDSCLDPAKVLYDQNPYTSVRYSVSKLTEIQVTRTTVSKTNNLFSRNADFCGFCEQTERA